MILDFFFLFSFYLFIYFVSNLLCLYRAMQVRPFFFFHFDFLMEIVKHGQCATFFFFFFFLPKLNSNGRKNSNAS